MSYDKVQVKESIDLEDMFELLNYLQAEPQIFDDHIVALTICHDGDSHKLYYFDNTKLFRCFTHCGNFDIFELLQKTKGLSLNEAIYFVVNFFNLQTRIDNIDSTFLQDDWKVMRRWQEISELTVNNDKIVLPEYDNNILNFYPRPRIIDWESEFINKEVMDKMNICFDPISDSILIPHNDSDSRLVGIRSRTLVKDNEIYGKYRPWKHNDILYNHPLAFNLYGLDVAKNNIAVMKKAIVVESEFSL